VLLLTTTFLVGFAVADPTAAALVWAGLIAVAGFGALWPAITVRSVGLQVVSAPTDLVVGQLGWVQVQLSSRASGLTLRCSGSPLLVADVVSPGAVRIPLEVSARGVYTSIRVDLGSDAPFGVALAVRTRTLTLPRRLLVGPQTIRQAAPVDDLIGPESLNLPKGLAAAGESVRSVRPYVSGDPRQLVHWPSTARLGALVVRELEPPVATGLAIIVDLTVRHACGLDADEADADEAASTAEQTASRAAGLAEDALDHGARVVLCTAQSGGPVTGEVTGLLQLRRRLALATQGVPAAAPEGWPVVRVGPTAGVVEVSGVNSNLGSGSVELAE